jgi:iron complex outermembrane receptor protein
MTAIPTTSAALGAFANERFKPSSSAWVPTYAGTYAGALLPIYLQGGTANAQQLAGAHAAARAAANNGIPAVGSKEFQDMVNAVRNDFFQRNPPGAGFFDDSRMYHAEAGYNFREIISPDVVELLIGGNFRQYDLYSDGTIFNEDPDGDGTFERIAINEFGGYLQAAKRLFNDALKITGSIRYDKNENFDGQFSPRVSAVYTAGANRQHNIRASYQTGFRNPSTQNQFIFFPTGQGTLVGSTEANAARYGIHNGGAYTNASYNAFIGSVLAGQANPALLVERNLAYIQPEQLKAIEFGYKGFGNAQVFDGPQRLSHHLQRLHYAGNRALQGFHHASRRRHYRAFSNAGRPGIIGHSMASLHQCRGTSDFHRRRFGSGISAPERLLFVRQLHLLYV